MQFRNGSRSRFSSPWALALMLTLLPSASLATPRLDFQTRVEMQVRLERAALQAHDSSLADETLRDLAVWKVRRFVALDDLLRRNGVAATDSAELRNELQNRARAPNAKQRLTRVFAALDNDARLIEECWIRPQLVELRAREWFDRHRSSPTELFEVWLRDQVELAGEREIPEISESNSLAPPLDSSGLCYPDGSWNNGVLDDQPPAITGAGVWTGSDLVITDGLVAFRYNLSADRWTRTSDIPNAVGRAGLTAIWTGTRMLVWGGDYRNDGYSYDPSADTWQSISTAGAPIGRSDHTAVWTGNRMLVWGGATDATPTSVTNTGASYDPATDSWQPIPVTGAPVARRQHVAVWTGTQMLIWGGIANTDELNTGSRFDPQANSWSPITLTGAPTTRTRAKAVWTGSEMLVWGGILQNGGTTSYPVSGGRYQPSTDQWQKIPTGPSGRVDHSAVWSGTEMIIHGGIVEPFSPAAPVSWRYNPTTNNWSFSAAEPLATARYRHIAAWDGSGMIVWGGSGWAVEPTDDLRAKGARWRGAAFGWVGLYAGDPNKPAVLDPFVAWTGDSLFFASQSREVGVFYSPLQDAWTSTNAAWPPLVGYSFYEDPATDAMGWDGSRINLFEFGRRTIRRYELARDRWVYGSLAGMGSEYLDFTGSIWTGSSLIAYGGMANEEGSIYYYTDEWRRYDSATDRWETSWPNRWNTPNPGGSWNANLFSAGDRTLLISNKQLWSFDATNSRWTRLSDAPTTAGYRSDCNFWTGDQIVRIRESDRYVAATNQWLPISSIGKPANGAVCCAWTGREILVISRPASGAELRTWSYDPQLDQWSASSSRSGLDSGDICAWTGSELIIWNASSGGDRKGGRYALRHQVDDDGDGYTECAGDCDDGRNTTHPLAVEICNGIDDDCDGIVDEGGADGDADGVVDCRDNCVGVSNPTQADDDRDGFGNPCDCAPTDKWDAQAPGEVQGVEWFYQYFNGPRVLGWKQTAGTLGNGIEFDVESGVVGQWPIGSQPGEVCYPSNHRSAWNFRDSTTKPIAGSAYWYLVRAKNSCGTAGYGANSAGVPRTPNHCP